jgi:hypothetical protein
VRKSGAVAETNQLTELGQKIFLDRYALKDMSKRTLSTGDMVIVCTDAKTGQRELASLPRWMKPVPPATRHRRAA